MIASFALGLFAAAVQPAAGEDIPSLASQARAALEQIDPKDRLVGKAVYARILVDAGPCDEAAAILSADPRFDPYSIDAIVKHAVDTNALGCAATLGALLLERSGTDPVNAVRYAHLRMFAGAALRVSGREAEGLAAIEQAEATLSRPLPNAKWPDRQNQRTLWDARMAMLNVYVGTRFYDPALLAYAREMAVDPNSVWTLQSGALIARLSAAGQMDLVRAITAKMRSSADREEVTRYLELRRRQDVLDIYGKKGIPHCPGAVKDDLFVTPMERPQPDFPIIAAEPLARLIRIRLAVTAERLSQRCPPLLD